MQFASYRSGKVELIIANGPNSTCIQAAQEVLDGARVGDYLFFMTKYYADYYRISEYDMIGNHAFFYRWITNDPEEGEDNPEDGEEEIQDVPVENPSDGGEGQEDGGEDAEDNSEEVTESEDDGGEETEQIPTED